MSALVVAVPREAAPGERRVALVPAEVPELRSYGHTILVELSVGWPSGPMRELEAANAELPLTDVAPVVGANDVTNPAARRLTAAIKTLVG